MSKIFLKLCKFSPWNSLNLDLGKMCEPCNSLLAQIRESQGTWVPTSHKKSGNFTKTIGWKPCDHGYRILILDGSGSGKTKFI